MSQAVAVAAPRQRARAPEWLSCRRGLVAVAIAWAAFATNCNFLSLSYVSDATRPYGFVQALFGDRGTADAYQFGLGLAEAPFYALGKLLALLGIDSIAGKPVLPAA